MEIYVFDMGLNHLGVIDDFKQVETEQHYKKMGYLYLTVDANKDSTDLLRQGRILVKSTDFSRGYIIPKREYRDEKSSVLEISAISLNVLLHRRIVLGQQVYQGNFETVIKSFVDKNAVNTIPNRIIPNLIIDSVNRCDLGTGTETAVNMPLDELTYELCNKYDCSWNVFIDLDKQRFIFSTWKGTDRSVEQNENPHIIFAKDFDNILRQNYVEDDSNFRSTCIVSGEDEGLATRYVIVNDDLGGFERHEVYCDANNVKKSYSDENGNEKILTDVEYNILLKAEGEKVLSGHQRIITFESDVDLYSNNVFNVDYFLGDKVSIRNDDLDIILHTRIISAYETVNKSGTSLKIDFGSNIPTLIDKIKRAVK